MAGYLCRTCFYDGPLGDSHVCKDASEENLFYVQNVGRYSGDSLIWHKAGRYGYTTDLDAAGKFSKAEARSMEQMRRGEDKAWPVQQIDGIASRQVNVERLWAAQRSGVICP